jgi:hypothetical protein
MTINPYLIARLYVLQEAFAHPGYQPATFAAPKSAANKPKPFDWNDLLKDEDKEGDQGGGGGGTIKGLRGKNDVAGKAALRRLGRK